MKHIQSANNPQIKQWRKLLAKKERDKTGMFLAEGYHLAEEALKGEKAIELIISENAELPVRWDYGELPVTMVTDEIIKSLSDTET
ncbi:RNA methyltransferase, partial [Exiguobacterium sp. IPBC4]